MRVKYFRPLLVCISLSLAVLLVGLGWGRTSWIWLPAAVLPLMYYHLVFLRRRIQEAPDSAAIDSVYYFGFLITVAALALSAVSLARSTTPDFHVVLIKFGIGMVATGYALIARMHLQSLTLTQTEQSAESVMATYLHRTQELIDNVEVASVRVNEFAQIVLDETRETHIRTQARIEDTLLGSAQAFQREMETVLATIRGGISSIGSLMDEVSAGSERDRLVETVKETIGSARELNAGMKLFGAHFVTGADSIVAARGALDALKPSLEQMNSSLVRIGAPDGTLSQVANGLLSLTESSEKATSSARDALLVTQELTSNLREQDSLVVAMAELTKNTTDQFHNLAQAGASLNGALAKFTAAIETTEILSENLKAMQQSFPALASEIEATAKTLGDLKQSLSNTARDVESDARRSNEATLLLTKSLAEVARTIIQQTRVHQGLPS